VNNLHWSRNSKGSDKITAELIQATGDVLLSKVHTFTDSIWSRKTLPDHSKGSVTPIYKEGNKIDGSNYRGISPISHDLYSSPSIIRIIKSRRMRWAGHIAGMGEKRNAYSILVGKPEGKRPLGRPRRR
jgi:hypothetical protein